MLDGLFFAVTQAIHCAFYLLFQDMLLVVRCWDNLLLNLTKSAFRLREEVTSCPVAVIKASVDNFGLPISFECITVFFLFGVGDARFNGEQLLTLEIKLLKRGKYLALNSFFLFCRFNSPLLPVL